MQIRLRIATTAGAGLLVASGLGLAFAGPAAAAPVVTPPAPRAVAPSPVASPSTLPAPRAVAPSQIPVPPQGTPPQPRIAVPAGNARPSTDAPAGMPTLALAALLAAGCLFAGGGTVMAIRRRR